MALRIPKEEQAGLVKILGLDSSAVEKMISALEGAPPSLKPKPLVDALVSHASFDESDAIMVVDTISSLYAARAYFGYSAEGFASELYEAIQDSNDDKLRIYARGDDALEVLERLLSIESLGTAMKAQAVLREYQRSYCDARILTDLRPVFGSSADEAPVGAGVVHSLRIAYHERSELKEFFVALGEKDLQDLIAILQRAEKKQKSLQRMIEKAQIRLLDYKSD